ncbi:LemA family protein [Fluviicola sp.]|uniref:LemA family protein n=1 Tax=Fluviicola sp. TaxID=1917219 RepID=UPI0026050C56|nr:LemA family protein [Fluviicola sp.]
MLLIVIPVVIILIFVIAVIVIKNGLIAKENQVENAFASVDVMLKKRFDLIPQLTSCVSGYMTHEKDLLEKLTALRSGSRDTEALAQGNHDLQNQFSQFLIKAEAYPDLKASEQFMMLQRSMNEMEEQLSAARRTYNMSIEIFNNAVLQFPSSVIARRNRMEKKEYLKFND